jgi:large subunit ribosomal protein L29
MADLKEMRAAALHDLTDAELIQRLADAKEEQFNLRFQLATGQLENSARIGEVRRYIARINTLIREREIAAAEAAEEQA